MTADRPLLGIALMTGFCILAPLGDSIAKLLGEVVPLGQLLLVRFALQAVLLLPFVYLSGHRLSMNRRVLGLTIWRTVLHIVGIGAMFTSLRFLPLADAVAIAFVMPFIMLLLGYYFLNEEVGRRRLLACVVGFVGTLFVIQPSFQNVGWPAFLPLVVAVVFSLFILVTRQVAKDVEPMVLQTVSGMMATVFLAALLLFAIPFDYAPLAVVTTDTWATGLLLLIGVLGTVAHLLMTWSLRFAPSATLAPMQYLEIPFATIIGYLVFSDWPNGMAFTGILITISAGLYIIWRERKTAHLA